MARMKETSTHQAEQAQSVRRWRNFFLNCAVPAMVWTLYNQVDGLFISHELLRAFDSAVDPSVRARLLITKEVIPFGIGMIAVEASERLHMKYRSLDKTMPIIDLRDRTYDVLTGLRGWRQK